MRDFIVTTIIALAAAKAKAQAQDKSDNQKAIKKQACRKHLEGTQAVVNYMGHRINLQ
jgi:hypothetical protein